MDLLWLSSQDDVSRMNDIYGENKKIMVLDEFNIHAEKELERRILY